MKTGGNSYFYICIRSASLRTEYSSRWPPSRMMCLNSYVEWQTTKIARRRHRHSITPMHPMEASSRKPMMMTTLGYCCSWRPRHKNPRKGPPSSLMCHLAQVRVRLCWLIGQEMAVSHQPHSARPQQEQHLRQNNNHRGSLCWYPRTQSSHVPACAPVQIAVDRVFHPCRRPVRWPQHPHETPQQPPRSSAAGAVGLDGYWATIGVLCQRPRPRESDGGRVYSIAKVTEGAQKP